jgi:hypothetical protein
MKGAVAAASVEAPPPFFSGPEAHSALLYLVKSDRI